MRWDEYSGMRSTDRTTCNDGKLKMNENYVAMVTNWVLETQHRNLVCTSTTVLANVNLD